MTDPARAETEYFNGYEHGRMLCLTRGAHGVEQWLRTHRDRKDAFRAGVVSALWDWEDANGMPHSSYTQRRGADAG